MSCLIPLVASACLLDPSQMEVQVDVSRRFAGDFTYHAGARNFGGGNLFTAELSFTIDAAGPFTFRYGLRHESLVDQRDEANRRAFVGFTWKPFIGAK